MFQANQLTALVGQTVFDGAPPAWSGLATGLVLAVLVGVVIFGGLPRVAKVAVRSLPAMVAVYVTMTLYVVLTHITEVPALLWLTDWAIHLSPADPYAAPIKPFTAPSKSQSGITTK